MAFVAYSNHEADLLTASHNGVRRSHIAGWLYLICIIAFTNIMLLITAHEIYLNTQQTFSILKQQKKEIEHLANHDHLTGLSTPRLAEEQFSLAIKLAKRHNDRVAVLYIDIDKFKYINDTFGHDTGDFALREVAQSLRNLTRDSDIASRQGGDEFVVVLNYPTSRNECEKICKRLFDSFRHRRNYDAHSFEINLSIGVALYPENGSDQETLRKNADSAMYIAKREEGSKVEFSESC